MDHQFSFGSVEVDGFMLNDVEYNMLMAVRELDATGEGIEVGEWRKHPSVKPLTEGQVRQYSASLHGMGLVGAKF